MPEQPKTGGRSHRGRRAPVLAVKTTTRLCRPTLTSLDEGAARPSWPIEDCVLRPGRTSPPNDCARAVTFCRRTQSSTEKYVLDLRRHSPQGRSAPSGTVPYSRWRPAPSGDILRGRVRVTPGGGIRRRRGQDSCPRTRGSHPTGGERPRARGMPPVGGKCPRPREAPPPKVPEPHAPCPSRPHTRRAGPHTCWDPARRSDEARRLKQQPRPAPLRPSCRRRCAPAP